MSPPAVHLCMIVKNESHIIRRSLASSRPFFQRWTIVDTGSTDGTQDAIRSALADCPGALHEEPWINFAHNRNQCVELAEAAAGPDDYLLMVDADDRLEGRLPDPLDQDCYMLRTVRGATLGWRPHLWRARARLRYGGVTHEALLWTEGPSIRPVFWPHLRYVEGRDSFRNLSGRKLTEDRDLLEQATRDNPADARAWMYLGQSYRDLAAHAFEQRTALGGWREESAIAALQAAHNRIDMGASRAEVVGAFLLAIEAAPDRAEPPFALARYLRLEHRMHAAAYPFAAAAAAIALPPRDVLGVQASIYEWHARDEQAVCAYWIGRYAECVGLCEVLLRTAPSAEWPRIATNRDRALERLPKDWGALGRAQAAE